MLYKKIKDYIRYFILKTGSCSLLNKAYLLLYRISLIFIILVLKRLKTIKAICLEGSLIQEKSQLKAGSTDIDLIIITEKLSPRDELKFIYAYIKKCISLKKIFPFLKDYSALDKSTVYIHSFAKILGPYHFKKYSRLYKTIYGNISQDHYPEKLSLGLESYTPVDFFILIRTVLRPINEDIFNLETNKKAYVRNSIINIKRVIDYINLNIPDFKYELPIKRLNEKIKAISGKNFFIHPNDCQFYISTINDFYKLSEECLIHLLPAAQNQDIHANKTILLTKNNLPNETLEYAGNEIKEKISFIYRKVENTFYNISILPEYNCNYQYTVYLILKDTLEPQAIKYIYDALKKIYNPETRTFVSYSHPIILTKKLFEINKSYVKSNCGPLDILLFNKLIYKIAGNDLNGDLKEEATDKFLNTKLYGNISKVDYNYLIESHNIFEQLMEHLQNKNILETRKTTDYLLGAIASHRLAVEKGIITSTPLETLTEYVAHYPNEELTEWYEHFYRKFYDTKMPFSLQFIKSQTEDLFYFYSKNRDITNDAINSNLKNNFKSYEY